jgi:hypothetical protein
MKNITAHGDAIKREIDGPMSQVMEHGYLRKSIEDRVERKSLIRNFNSQRDEVAR